MHDDGRTDDGLRSPPRDTGRGSMLRDILVGYSRDRGALLSAAIAFYALLAIAPVLLLAVAIAGLVYGQEAARAAVVTQLEETMGPAASALVSALLEAVSNPDEGRIATLVGGLAILYAASRLFVQLQTALNQIWNVSTRPARRLRGALAVMLLKRVLSFVLIVVLGLLLIGLLVGEAALRAAEARWGDVVPASELLFRAGSFVVSLALVTVFFATVYKVLPDVRVAWRDVWRGAFLSALLFAVGRLLLGLWFGYFSFGSVYGAAGSFFVLMLWLYYSAQVFFIGAEMTQVHAERRGASFEPSRFAARLPGFLSTGKKPTGPEPVA